MKKRSATGRLRFPPDQDRGSRNKWSVENGYFKPGRALQNDAPLTDLGECASGPKAPPLVPQRAPNLAGFRGDLPGSACAQSKCSVLFAPCRAELNRREPPRPSQPGGSGFSRSCRLMVGRLNGRILGYSPLVYVSRCTSYAPTGFEVSRTV